MKKSFCFLLVCFAMAGLWSCSKDENPTPPASTKVSFAASLDGAQETPPNASAAYGDADGSFDTNTKILTLTVTYYGLTPTLGHIHEGAVGVKGDVVFPFTSLASPISFSTPALSAAQETTLMNGGYYVNLHTAAYTGGEIRGQLLKQ